MNLWRRFFIGLISHYLSGHIPAGSDAVEVSANDPQGAGSELRIAGVEPRLAAMPVAGQNPAYVIMNGTFQDVADIQTLLGSWRAALTADSRLIVLTYSALWRPLLSLATWLGMRKRHIQPNWVAPEDVANLLRLEGFEVVRHERKILLPLPIPGVAWFVNRFLAPLPLINSLCLLNIVIARPAPRSAPTTERPSVSVVVPARNEAGNIAAIVARLPAMGPDDELIFVEGNSTDATWAEIQRVAEEQRGKRSIVIAQQSGRGKGDAVRMGFSLATRDVLMILDADLTVPPEELPRFYRVIADGLGEFVNGSRLVYPMEARAMQFSNLLANKAFALAFSFVLGQRFKDTLCGTKALSRRHYQAIAANRGYFGDFDPFGDFDLIFGAARLGLKLVEIPIHYKERTYGSTNIQRWRHGVILAWMLLFAARKIKFL